MSASRDTARIKKDPLAPLKAAPPHMQEMIRSVLQAEKRKINMESPIGIVDDILEIIRTSIRGTD